MQPKRPRDKDHNHGNLDIGLAIYGKKVLFVDADPQGDLTTTLGWPDNACLSVTLSTVMDKIIREEDFDPTDGILHHDEGVDLAKEIGITHQAVNKQRQKVIAKLRQLMGF
jgi:cellulose biosynthesis protein BcsQ